VDGAEVVVCNTSTLGLESTARGRKTAFFTIHKHIYEARNAGLVWDRGMSWPVVHDDEGPFWTSRPDPAAFVRILDHLFAISDEQWRAELSTHQFGDIMTYDPGNAILQSILTRELGASTQEKRP
jgi:surface carbohydrate biosynthesis protein